MFRLRSAILGIATLTWSAMIPFYESQGADYFPPQEAFGGWRKTNNSDFIFALGLEPERVTEYGRYNLSIDNSHMGGYDYGYYKSALVVKNGWIVGEWYNRPDGQQFKNYLSSNGKSFVIALFGVMLEDRNRGELSVDIDLDSRVYDRRWLPQGFPLSDPRKAEITFDQIFQHTSGLMPEVAADGTTIEIGRNRWSNYVRWVVGHDPLWPETGRLFFSPGKPREFVDHETWGSHIGAYSSIGFAHLGLVFQNIYRRPVDRILRERLLQHLGFSGVDYHLPPTPQIKWFTAGGLRMTTRDYARFAYFLLRSGKWNNRQLLPEGWLDHFIQSACYPNIRSNIDGYFGDEYPKDMFRIFGSGGNLAIIVPSLDLIALRTGRVSSFLQENLHRDFTRRVFRMIPGYD